MDRADDYDVITLILWELDPTGVLCQIVCKTTAQLSKARYINILHGIPIRAEKYLEYINKQDVYIFQYYSWPGYFRTVMCRNKVIMLRNISIEIQAGGTINVEVTKEHNTLPAFPEKVLLQNGDPVVAYRILLDKYRKLGVTAPERKAVSAYVSLLLNYLTNYGTLFATIHIYLICLARYPKIIAEVSIVNSKILALFLMLEAPINGSTEYKWIEELYPVLACSFIKEMYLLQTTDGDTTDGDTTDGDTL